MQQAIIDYFNLHDMSIGHYQWKDIQKFGGATKLVAFGTSRSSTDIYSKAIGSAYPNALNQHEYTEHDVVVVSVNGNRAGAILPTDNRYRNCLYYAILANATIVTDDLRNRSRHYNTGEQLLATMLENSGYSDPEGKGIWNRSS